jgi:Ca-activated chloride channel family protein
MKTYTRYGRLLLPVLVLSLAALRPAAAETEGCLRAFSPDHQVVGLCPLKHTDVQVDIAGFVARVTLTQRFENPYPHPIEAVYTFPMSERAAVDSMEMRIGDRVIRGDIKRREEARQIYEQARDAGKAASLLDQERPNIFTQSVANILPGHAIEVTISYVEYLKYEDGEYEYSFPMVVGPRYIPGNVTAPGQPVSPLGRKAGPESTDQVPDAGKLNPPITPEGTRAGHDISLTVHVDAGLPLQALNAKLHEVDVTRPSGNEAVVRLRNQNEIPNRDFILKYGVAGNAIGDAVLTHTSAQGGFFTLVLHPPARVVPKAAAPKEMIFVIDCSGSMSGFPIEKAKRTMELAIEGMNPNDTFNLVSFAGGVGYCFDRPQPNSQANRRAALQYLRNLQGGGGTEMMKAIHAALGNQHDPDRLRLVCFMTDGYIGNDFEIIDAIQKNAGSARVFSFGIGNSINRFLLEGMARAGRGEAEIVSLESDGDAAAQRFHERIQSPVLTDISIDFGGLPVEEVFPDPTAIPDLFASKPLVLKGRYTGSGSGTVTVRGNTAAGPFEREIAVDLPKSHPENDVLAPLWARARIGWLMYQDLLGAQQGEPNPDVKEAIVELGLAYNLLTQYTSFVAVEEKVINEDGKPKTVEVPVEMPDGVSYEGIFGKDEAEALPALGRSFGARGVARQSLAKSAAPAPMQQRVLGRRAQTEVAAESLVALADVDEAKKPADDRVEREEAAIISKLDLALRGLAAKVVNGAYSEGAVKVANGKLQVFIELNDLKPETLQQLRELGVIVKSTRESAKTVLATVAVKDLEVIAALGAVKKITPPTF